MQALLLRVMLLTLALATWPIPGGVDASSPPPAAADQQRAAPDRSPRYQGDGVRCVRVVRDGAVAIACSSGRGAASAYAARDGASASAAARADSKSGAAVGRGR